MRLPQHGAGDRLRHPAARSWLPNNALGGLPAGARVMDVAVDQRDGLRHVSWSPSGLGPQRAGAAHQYPGCRRRGGRAINRPEGVRANNAPAPRSRRSSSGPSLRRSRCCGFLYSLYRFESKFRHCVSGMVAGGIGVIPEAIRACPGQTCAVLDRIIVAVSPDRRPVTTPAQVASSDDARRVKFSGNHALVQMKVA